MPWEREWRHHHGSDLAAPMEAIACLIQSFVALVPPTYVKRLSKSFSYQGSVGLPTAGGCSLQPDSRLMGDYGLNVCVDYGWLHCNPGLRETQCL